MREKYCIWNPNTCTCENGKYLESIIGASVNTCDEIIIVAKTVSIKTITKKRRIYCFNKFNEKKGNLSNRKFLYFTYFLLITIYRTIDNR